MAIFPVFTVPKKRQGSIEQQDQQGAVSRTIKSAAVARPLVVVAQASQLLALHITVFIPTPLCARIQSTHVCAHMDGRSCVYICLRAGFCGYEPHGLYGR